jgi:hypothetical protein
MAVDRWLKAFLLRLEQGRGERLIACRPRLRMLHREVLQAIRGTEALLETGRRIDFSRQQHVRIVLRVG